MVSFTTAIPSPSSVFSAYASISASAMLIQTVVNQWVPRPVKDYISSAIRCYFKPKSSNLVVVIEESDGISNNEIYSAAETYLYSKSTDSSIQSLKITKRPKEPAINIKFGHCKRIVDYYDDVEVVWCFNCEETKKASKHSDDDSGKVFSAFERRYFELSFHTMHKEKILGSYVPYILKRSKDIRAEKKVLKLHTLSCNVFSSCGIMWESINLEHPSTFDTLALDRELKRAIIEDLDRFVRRKDFYRKVGKAWKRGYLLHGPPGTGKSSLIAAMANYLKFDIYDLELGNIKSDSDLRRLLLKTANRSILVIEDIDCTVELPDRMGPSPYAYPDGHRREHKFTLSGLLNFIDGLWSSCGDERIIIFTTNNKDKLDPALLRPGRMDMHISLSYLTAEGFKTLATNYLDIKDNPRLRFEEIEELIESMNVTPAEVAEELMKSDDADVSLGGLVSFLNLKRKRINDHDDEMRSKENNDEIDQVQKGKKLKLDISKDNPACQHSSC